MQDPIQATDLDPRYYWFKIKLKGCDPKTDIDFFFRGLTYREYKTASNLEDDYLFDDYVLKTCVVPKLDWDRVLLGTTLRLLQEIKARSGVGDHTIWEKAVEWFEEEEGGLQAVAAMMVPNCSIEYLDNCDPIYRAKNILLGKILFESSFKIPAEQAWKPQKGQSSVNKQTVLPKDQVDPNTGKLVRMPGQQTETFGWQAGQPLNVHLEDPDFSPRK